MDVGLYVRVLWRFKPVVLVGLILAIGLATLSIARVGPSGVTYRQSELWTSTTRLLVTQQGFPWGRLLATQETTPAAQAAALGIPVVDPARLDTLAILYSELATSDPVLKRIKRDGPMQGKLLATPVVVGENRVSLPLIDLAAIAKSPNGAAELAGRAASAFDSFLRTQQAAAKVPAGDRVVIQQVVRPSKAKVFQARSKTMPIVVFLAVMFAAIGLAFLLENVRPREPRVEKLDESAEPGLRRSA